MPQGLRTLGAGTSVPARRLPSPPARRAVRGGRDLGPCPSGRPRRIVQRSGERSAYAGSGTRPRRRHAAVRTGRPDGGPRWTPHRTARSSGRDRAAPVLAGPRGPAAAVRAGVRPPAAARAADRLDLGCGVRRLPRGPARPAARGGARRPSSGPSTGRSGNCSAGARRGGGWPRTSTTSPPRSATGRCGSRPPLVLAWFARWRQLLVYLGTVSVIAALAQVAAGDAAFARAVRRGVTGSAAEVVVPAWPVIVLAAVTTATVLALAPAGPARRVGVGAGGGGGRDDGCGAHRPRLGQRLRRRSPAPGWAAAPRRWPSTCSPRRAGSRSSTGGR